MDRLKTEISRTKTEIETIQRQLDGMLKDYSVPIWQPIETNRSLKELTAYLKGLECQTEYSSIETTVTVSSSASSGCKECKFGPGFNSTLGERIEHYIKHGYKLLYFGQETSGDDEGRPWHKIVAVLGKNKPATTQGSVSGAA
jgi:hypothetical protein